MKTVHELRDIGIGQRALIIGGGHSVNEIDFSTIPQDVTVFEINYPRINIPIDYSFYYDADIKQFWNDNKDKYPGRQIIGFITHKGVSDFTYRFSDIVFGDSGFHCLQLCDSLFNFSEIFLIGYDYRVMGDSYHHNEKQSDPDKIMRFTKWSIGNVKEKYKLVKWRNEIHHLTENTDLNIFSKKNLTLY